MEDVMVAPSRMMSISFVLSLLLAACPAPGQESAAAPEHIRGITISTHGAGRDWGTDRIVSAFKAVKEIGADWVAIHPYASIRKDGSVRFRPFSEEEPPAYLVRPIKEAHALGLKILVKPHLAYWGSGFAWRGDITFESPAEWRRFFSSYEAWIVKLARTCKAADGFVVGCELDKTISHEQEWRRIIAEVRRATGAGLTYAANWTHYRDVPFWDALDVVGIQAYFPLVREAGAGEKEIRAGWKRRMRELSAFSEKTGRRVVFTELGYNRSFDAALRPWEHRTDGEEAERLQGLCLRVALEAVRREPTVIGSFLWKWFPPPRPVGRNFQLATPYLKSVISGVWKT